MLCFNVLGLFILDSRVCNLSCDIFTDSMFIPFQIYVCYSID